MVVVEQTWLHAVCYCPTGTRRECSSSRGFLPLAARDPMYRPANCPGTVQPRATSPRATPPLEHTWRVARGRGRGRAMPALRRVVARCAGWTCGTTVRFQGPLCALLRRALRFSNGSRTARCINGKAPGTASTTPPPDHSAPRRPCMLCKDRSPADRLAIRGGVGGGCSVGPGVRCRWPDARPYKTLGALPASASARSLDWKEG